MVLPFTFCPSNSLFNIAIYVEDPGTKRLTPRITACACRDSTYIDVSPVGPDTTEYPQFYPTRKDTRYSCLGGRISYLVLIFDLRSSEPEKRRLYIEITYSNAHSIHPFYFTGISDPVKLQVWILHLIYPLFCITYSSQQPNLKTHSESKSILTLVTWKVDRFRYTSMCIKTPFIRSCSQTSTPPLHSLPPSPPSSKSMILSFFRRREFWTVQTVFRTKQNSKISHTKPVIRPSP